MKESTILPDFPRTRHLPFKANASKGDTIASESETQIIFESDFVSVEEKIDGANTGMCLYDGNPIIRNRNHILNKAFTRRRTAAKMQFASIFNWFYENMDKFDNLNNLMGFEVAIYGEWMYAVHGIEYDKLPSIWIPYDIYDWENGKFISNIISREALKNVGFSVPDLLYQGKINSWEQLESFCNQKSSFSSNELREGIYVKVNDKNHIINRFKMVRSGFLQGSKWSDDKINKNRVI